MWNHSKTIHNTGNCPTTGENVRPWFEPHTRMHTYSVFRRTSVCLRCHGPVLLSGVERLMLPVLHQFTLLYGCFVWGSGGKI